MTNVTDILFLVAIAAVVTGVAFIYWPAAIILAGLFGLAIAVKLDAESS